MKQHLKGVQKVQTFGEKSGRTFLQELIDIKIHDKLGGGDHDSSRVKCVLNPGNAGSLYYLYIKQELNSSETSCDKNTEVKSMNYCFLTNIKVCKFFLEKA
jgi:hypothetical protein